MSEAEPQPAGQALIVREKRSQVDVLWGFLSLVFGAVLVRVLVGGSTETSSIVIGVICGALLVGSIAAWIRFRRRGAWLEVTPDVITFTHRGARGATKLLRTSGDLYFHLVGSPPVSWLKVSGSDEAIPMATFDQREVAAACREAGWRFRGDEGTDRA